MVGYVFYQKDAKEHSGTNKALQNLKLDLDVTNHYFYVQNENRNIYDLLLNNSPFVQFSDLHIQKQQAQYVLISKFKDLF